MPHSNVCTLEITSIDISRSRRTTRFLEDLLGRQHEVLGFTLTWPMESVGWRGRRAEAMPQHVSFAGGKSSPTWRLRSLLGRQHKIGGLADSQRQVPRPPRRGDAQRARVQPLVHPLRVRDRRRARTLRLLLLFSGGSRTQESEIVVMVKQCA